MEISPFCQPSYHSLIHKKVDSKIVGNITEQAMWLPVSSLTYLMITMSTLLLRKWRWMQSCEESERTAHKHWHNPTELYLYDKEMRCCKAPFRGWMGNKWMGIQLLRSLRERVLVVVSFLEETTPTAGNAVGEDMTLQTLIDHRSASWRIC